MRQLLLQHTIVKLQRWLPVEPVQFAKFQWLNTPITTLTILTCWIRWGCTLGITAMMYMVSFGLLMRPDVSIVTNLHYKVQLQLIAQSRRLACPLIKIWLALQNAGTLGYGG